MESGSSTLFRMLVDYAPYSYIVVVMSIIVWALIIHFIFNRLRSGASSEPYGEEEPPS